MNRVVAVSLASVFFAVAGCDRYRVTESYSQDSVEGMVVSDPLPASAYTTGITLSAMSTAGDVVYLSLAPGSVPGAQRLTIANKTKASAPVLVAVEDGGFDPVPVLADADDILSLTFLFANGTRIVYTVKVPPRRAPGVVRTDPAKGRVDVALNVAISVVFTEPVDPATVTGGTIRLIRQNTVVTGTVTMTNSLTAVFTPTSPLAQGTAYSIVVSADVKDLDGEPIGSDVISSFMTGATTATNCPGYANPTQCPPFPTGGPYSVSGRIFERTETGTRPVPGAFAYAWVQLSNRSGYSVGRLPVSAEGFYEAAGIPPSLVVLEAGGPGMTQPCMTSVGVGGGSVTGVDLEIESAANPLPDRHTDPPVVTGTVYEQTPTGRQPIAGASVWFDAAMDLWVANTTTDANGRYSLCRLVPLLGGKAFLTAAKDGYQISDASVDLEAVTHLDIELKR